MSRCAIVGSAFPGPSDLEPVRVATPAGEAVLHRHPSGGWLLFRHGSPHRWLPHQIPWRAHALALREVGVEALLVTSSVGVLDPTLPLFEPLLVTDLVWPDNRLPDGSVATVWPDPDPEQGHLVVSHGLFDRDLTAHTREGLRALGHTAPDREVVFAFAPGPRTKTRAENAVLVAQGIHVASMTLAPEVVLANELGIPTVAVVVGHKHSGPAAPGLDGASIEDSLVRSRAATGAWVDAFLAGTHRFAFRNHIYRFDP